jgi:LuxR family transcriptional regulator, maltose regulon positive regulatory protein
VAHVLGSPLAVRDPRNLSPEIADELYVAASTVKTHIKHIYAKLGAHRRTEAVDRARAAGLLASR